MGCGQSKIDQEETVARCKDRKRFIGEAVVARNGLAAAHSAYAISLKNTGAALSDYAQGESDISDIHRTHYTAAITYSSARAAVNPPADRILPPPPVPGRAEMMSPLQRSSSAPLVEVSKNKGKAPMTASITEEEDGDGDNFYETVPGSVLSDMMHEYPYKPENETAPLTSPPLPPPPPPPPPPPKTRTVTLLHVLNQLDDHFLKASASAHNVLKNLEAVRMHYHSNFADNRGYIDHSARVLNVITWNRSFRGAPENEEAKEDFDKDEWETHATILDKIFAWEKKLYDEVKEVEIMKMAYNERLALLNKKKKRGASSGSIERTKSIVSHLHTKYVVATQTMESTLSEIDRLRDSQLYPKLVELVEGLWRMWEAMNEHHSKQRKTFASLRNFDITATTKETSEQHHDRTAQLWEIVQEWNAQFHKLTTYQRDYVNALTNWVVLSVIPIDTDVNKKLRHQEPETPSQEPAELSDDHQDLLPIEKLLPEWSACLEKLQDEAAGTAIISFTEVIGTIIILQADELKLKQNCERLRKELEKKRRQFEDWRQKYMERQYSHPEPSGNPVGPGQDLLAERQAVVEALEKTLREEEMRYRDQCKHVREKSLIGLRKNLLELFRAMSEFSLGSSLMYKELLLSTQPTDEDDDQ
ncbi:protein ROLLING AND ERECT LEAF 2-like [Carex rostrata]